MVTCGCVWNKLSSLLSLSEVIGFDRVLVLIGANILLMAQFTSTTTATRAVARWNRKRAEERREIEQLNCIKKSLLMPCLIVGVV